jgi:hypothetical protein
MRLKQWIHSLWFSQIGLCLLQFVFVVVALGVKATPGDSSDSPGEIYTYGLNKNCNTIGDRHAVVSDQQWNQLKSADLTNNAVIQILGPHPYCQFPDREWSVVEGQPPLRAKVYALPLASDPNKLVLVGYDQQGRYVGATLEDWTPPPEVVSNQAVDESRPVTSFLRRTLPKYVSQASQIVDRCVGQ